MSWFDKTVAVAVLFGTIPGFGCSGKSQLVGSDGFTGGGGGGSLPVSDSTRYQLVQLEANEPGQPAKCLPIPLPLDARGEPSIEVFTSRRGAACDCAEPGLAPVGSEITRALQLEARNANFCHTPKSSLSTDRTEQLTIPGGDRSLS